VSFPLYCVVVVDAVAVVVVLDIYIALVGIQQYGDDKGH
jgi:hypothetical protein